MSVICSKYLSTSQFRYDPSTKVFTAFMSDFGALSDQLVNPVFGRVYDDSYDEGFVMISKMTGVEVVYVVGHTQTNDDNDVEHWDLVPITKTGRSYLNPDDPGYGTTVRIFND